MSKTATTPPAEPVVCAEFLKNTREVVRVSLTEYNGIALLDVRAYYRDGETMKPGKGIAIRRDQLGHLKKAIAAAEKAVKESEAAAPA